MIRNSESIIVKIFFEGKEIQKVYKQGIQVFPDAGFQKYFWLKVFDEEDQKTYYYHCTQTNIVYQEGSTEIIKEMRYTAGQKQENSPGENQQIYELVNDQVKITGNEYSENDFESFTDKTQEEVITMIPKYQEKIITEKHGGIQPNDYVNDNLTVEYDISNVNIVFDYHGQDLSQFSGNIGDYKYMMDWNKVYSNTAWKRYGFIKVENTDINDTTIQYVAWSRVNWGQVFISDSVEDLNTVINNGQQNLESMEGLKNIIICYGGYNGNWTSGFKSNEITTKKIYTITIPKQTTYYFCGYWYMDTIGTADQKDYTFSQIMMSIFYNKSVNIYTGGNFLNNKYISDTTHEKKIGKNKYNFAFVMIKNDLSKKVYQTNCKYIISKEELQGINVNNILQIPEYSLGWKLLTNAEFKTYSPKNSKYKFVLTVSNFKYTGDEFFGLLDKSGDYINDFRIFGAGSTDVYFDPGSDRINYRRSENNVTPVTFIINGKTNNFEAWENGRKSSEWNYATRDCRGFTDNNTGLYLNAHDSESKAINERLWFHEFKIVDVDSGEIIKRFVPSDDKTKLWESVSEKYIEPCRTVSESRLPVLLNKLDGSNVDGQGNKIEDWLIY